jgi:hypothetical protein
MREARQSSGRAPLGSATSKGSGREACDDPAPRNSSRGSRESRPKPKAEGKGPEVVRAGPDIAEVASGPREANLSNRLSEPEGTKVTLRTKVPPESWKSLTPECPVCKARKHKEAARAQRWRDKQRKGKL